jgi:T-complex protein 1 subunit delta
METQNGEVIITNDGATILRHMAVNHPSAKMVKTFPSFAPNETDMKVDIRQVLIVCLLRRFAQMVELSKSQDIEAGDGTTSVVVLAGGLLNACSTLLTRGIHPNQISDAFQLAATKADEILKDMAIPVDFGDRETLVKCTTTSLSSKVDTVDC